MDGQARPARFLVVPEVVPEGVTLSQPTSLWYRVDIGSACWARTSDPLINSQFVESL